MNLLACGTMAVLRVQWLLSAQLVLDLSTVTATIVASIEVWIIVVNLVGGSMLPFIHFAAYVAIITIVTIASVCGCVSHGPRAGVEVDLMETWNGSRCWTEGACCGIKVSCT